jgi:uncharacterized protein YlxP (DUF503 family)
MPLGLCTIDLRFPETFSLKDKRRILKSVKDRVHARFNVSIAEVGDNDSWRACSLAVTCVSNSAAQVNSVLSNVVRYIETERLDAELVDYNIEISYPF